MKEAKEAKDRARKAQEDLEGKTAQALRKAEVTLHALAALRKRSLIVRVCVGDERRYVSHSAAAR